MSEHPHSANSGARPLRAQSRQPKVRRQKDQQQKDPRQNDPRQGIGHRGEDAAVQFLLSHGWRIVARNWRCSVGEIDVIAEDPAGVMVFCEVKTRTGLGFGDPLESITWAKQRKLRQLAASWLHENPWPAVRIDAIGVLLHKHQPDEIRHVRGI